MKYKHGIYKVIHREFGHFISANRKEFQEMDVNTVKNIMYLSPSMIHQHPFNVVYVGRIEEEETDKYVFLNEDMEKVYTYEVGFD